MLNTLREIYNEALGLFIHPQGTSIQCRIAFLEKLTGKTGEVEGGYAK